MKEEIKKRIQALGKDSIDGIYGDEVKKSAIEYKNMDGIEVALKTVTETYTGKEDFLEIINILAIAFLHLFRETKKKDVLVAEAFINSLIKDYPDTEHTCLYHRWGSATAAILAFKMIKHDKSNKLLLWEQSLKTTQAINEFCNGLLGFLIICQNCILDNNIDTKIFDKTYSEKLNVFANLTGGEDSLFYLLFRLTDRHLRNSIAHGKIWLDGETDTVKYQDGMGKNHKEYSKPLLEYFVLFGVSMIIPRSYMTALSVAVVFEGGTMTQKLQLPPHLLKLLLDK